MSVIDNLRKEFEAFGYTPTDAELAQFVPIASAKYTGSAGATGSVASYVQAVRLEQERKGNDPLNKVIADERGFFNETEARIANLEGRTTGPIELFGGLSEDQINKYLAPLGQQTKESSARLAGASARRGITGSSTEYNALAENERKYRENVLASGLDVGMTERNRLTSLLEQQYGLLPGSLSRQAEIAGQQSSQEASATQFQQELPLYLRGISAQEEAIAAAIKAREDAAKQAKRAGIGKLIGTGVGAVAGGIFAAPTGGMSIPMGAMLGSQLGSSLGETVAGGGSTQSGNDLNSNLMAAYLMYPSGSGTYSQPSQPPSLLNNSALGYLMYPRGGGTYSQPSQPPSLLNNSAPGKMV